MIKFAIGRYGENDWRLIKWDGSTETEIGNGWKNRPDLENCLRALINHHGTGNSPFSSRDGAVDANILTMQWAQNKLDTRDMRLTDETMPWND